MNNQPKTNQSKIGKGLKIIGITTILIVIGAMGWFLVTKKSQDNTNLMQKNVEVENKDKQEVVKNEQEQGQGQNKNKEQEKVTESDLKNNQDNNQQDAEELKIEEIDTSNWKTYRNEEFGFEVKYPENLDLIKDYTYISDAKNISIGNVDKIHSLPGILISIEISESLNREFKKYNNMIDFLNHAIDMQYIRSNILTKNNILLYPVELYGNYSVKGFMFRCNDNVINILVNPNNNMSNDVKQGIDKNIINNIICIEE